MSQTLDQIFLSTAKKHASTIALTDCLGNARLGLGTINQLTYKQAEAYVNHCSYFFRSLGLKNGDIVHLQLPNIAETPLIMLALMNACLVPCLVPTHWRGREIRKAFQKFKPSAIITHQSIPDFNPFPTMFNLATEEISLRYILGLSENLPDGVTPLPNLSEIIATQAILPDEEEILFQRSGEQIACIGFTYDSQGTPNPVAYTHIQLMANAHLLSEKITQTTQASIVTTYSPTTLPGLVASFLPWVMEAGSLHISSSLNAKYLAERISNQAATMVLIPEALRNKLIATLNETAPDLPPPYMCLMSTTPACAETENPKQTPEIEHTTTLYNLNGFCLIYSLTGQKTELMKLGAQPGLDGQTYNPPFLETQLKGVTHKAGDTKKVMCGRLEISGTIVGFSDWQDNMTTTPLSNFNQHWEATSLNAIIKNETMDTLSINHNEDMIYYGSTPLSGHELDTLYQTYPGFVDAAAFTINDPQLGERLFAAIIPKPGDPLSYEDFKQYLLEQEISPTKIPEKLVTVTEIPRTSEGLIERQSILRN